MRNWMVVLVALSLSPPAIASHAGDEESNPGIILVKLPPCIFRCRKVAKGPRCMKSECAPFFGPLQRVRRS